MPDNNYDFRVRQPGPETAPWLVPAAPFVELYLGNADGSKLINLSVMPHMLRGFLTKETLGRTFPPVEATARLFDVSFDFLEDLILSGQTPQAPDDNPRNADGLKQTAGPVHELSSINAPVYYWYFRWGYPDGSRSGLYRAWMAKLDYEFQREGATIVVNMRSAFLENLSQVQSRTFSNVKVSDVIRRVLIEEGRNGVVQDTREVVREIRQVNMTNWAFLREVLLPLARSEAGKVGYDLVQHTGNPQLTADNSPVAPADTLLIGDSKFVSDNRGGVLVYRSYRFGHERSGLMTTFSPKIDWYWSGLAQVSGEGFDFRERKPLVGDAKRDTPEDYLYPESLNQLHPTPRRVSDIDPSRRFLVPYTDQASLDAWSRNKMEQLTRRTITAEAEIAGDPLIRPGYYIAVEVIKPNGELHWTSGFYRVQTVENEIPVTGPYVTRLTLVRYGVGRSLHEAQGTDSFAQALRDAKQRTDKAEDIEKVEAAIDRIAEPLTPPPLFRSPFPFIVQDRLEAGLERGLVSPTRANSPDRVQQYDDAWKNDGPGQEGA